MSPIAQKSAKSLSSRPEPTTAALLASIGERFGDDCPSLATLIARHDEARKADELLWNIVSDITDLPQMATRPLIRVQIGRLYHGRDDGGNDIWEPKYGHNEDAINTQIDQHLEAQLSIMPGDKRQDDRDRIRAGYEKKRAQLLNELREKQAERQQIEDEAGYTDATEAAKLASDAVRRLESEIVSFVPTTLSEAALKAGFVATVYLDELGYIESPEELVDALAAIGRALA